MDEIRLIWGPARKQFSDVGEQGGPQLWPIGVDYSKGVDAAE